MLTDSEQKKLLDMVSGLDKMALLLLLDTELELEDLINLRVQDMDLENGTLRIAPDRKLKLSSHAIAELREYLKSRPGQGYILEGRCGKNITCKWRRCVLERLLHRSQKQDGQKESNLESFRS